MDARREQLEALRGSAYADPAARAVLEDLAEELGLKLCGACLHNVTFDTNPQCIVLEEIQSVERAMWDLAMRATMENERLAGVELGADAYGDLVVELGTRAVEREYVDGRRGLNLYGLSGSFFVWPSVTVTPRGAKPIFSPLEQFFSPLEQFFGVDRAVDPARLAGMRFDGMSPKLENFDPPGFVEFAPSRERYEWRLNGWYRVAPAPPPHAMFRIAFDEAAADPPRRERRGKQDDGSGFNGTPRELRVSRKRGR